MPTIKAIDLSEDIITASLQEVADGAILVYPTTSSAQRAMELYQPSWNLELVQFLTMDEFKSRVIIPDGAYLQDEKRLLCLYQVLSEEDKESFHINNYDDIIEWGRHWFDFFTELCEEDLSPLALQSKVSQNEFYLQIWQEEYISRILDIRDRYQNLVNSKQFTDKIFYYDLAHYQPIADYTSYIFVNQYYYTALERKIIERLEGAGNSVTILFHGLSDWIDPTTLKSKAFDIDAVVRSEKHSLQSLTVHEFQNQDQMVLRFLSKRVSVESRNVLVDRRFSSEAYQTLFDPRDFAYPMPYSIVETPLYQMLFCIGTQLEALIIESDLVYIPINQIFTAFSQDWFIKYFCPDWTHIQQSLLLRELSALTEDDYLYLDLDLDVFEPSDHPERSQYLRALLRPHFTLLKQFMNIKSIEELSDLFDNPEGIELQRIIPTDLYQFTDICSQFYERLANFRAIEHLNIVEQWDSIFAGDGKSVASGLIRLFLQYLRTAQIKLPIDLDRTPSFTISSLLDTRNQSYDSAVFFHAIEGELPSNPVSVWLLNETQRRYLGLKTWDDVRDWERYYFLRLVFSTPTVDIYSYKNQENDIEISSFVSELMHYTDTTIHDDGEAGTGSLKLPIASLYHSLLDAASLEQHTSADQAISLQSLCDSAICDHKLVDKQAFFTIPVDISTDFGRSQELRMSYSSLDAFLKNPFAWYITRFKRIRERNIEVAETTTRKFFGTVLHRFVGTVLHDYIERHPGVFVPDPAFLEEKYLRTTLLDILNGKEFRYKIPKNYNRDFLFEVITPSLITSVIWVFQDFLFQIPGLENSRVDVIPEDLGNHNQAPVYKLLIKADANSVSVKIHGRADLLIETSSRKYIIDFKTGKGSIDQLIVYELFYYLLEQKSPVLFDIESMICNIFDMTRDTYNFTEDKRIDLISKVEEQLSGILQYGYQQARKVSERKTLINISRADLFSGSIGAENE